VLGFALSHLVLLGIESNIEFLQRLFKHPEFLAGTLTTHFIEEHPELVSPTTTLPTAVLVAAALIQVTSEYWRNNPNRPIHHRFVYGVTQYVVSLTPQTAKNYTVHVGETSYLVEYLEKSEQKITFTVNGHRHKATFAIGDEDNWWVHTLEGIYRLRYVSPLPLPTSKAHRPGSLCAPMPCQVAAVLVMAGQKVEKGESLVILKAMKMEHRLEAPYKGTVGEIYYQPGQFVEAGATLIELAGV
jgi:acetyl/propionyl-CoA carboxylase alpha subunit